MSRLIELIRELSDIPGVSGREDMVREKVLSLVSGHCDSHATDPTGNLIVYKKGENRPKSRLLLSAHMDEVGFIITHVEQDGLLRFSCVGGIDPRIIPGKPVEIGPSRLGGVVGCKAGHLLSEKEKGDIPEPDKLFIDIGARSREEALAHLSPGDRAVFSSEFLRLGDHRIVGRAFDDRAGCALLISLLEEPLPYDCTFAFTVQEETGCTGGMTAGYSVAPDICVVVETTTAADISGVSSDRAVCRLGEGPVISYMDKGTVYDSELYRLAFETALQEGIPCQTKSLVAGGNEARSIQTAGDGARALALSLPCRYLHSPSNMLDERDIHESHRLLKALIARLPAI